MLDARCGRPLLHSAVRSLRSRVSLRLLREPLRRPFRSRPRGLPIRSRWIRAFRTQPGKPAKYLAVHPWKDVTTRGNAPDATTAYFLYDDKNLYVAFVAPQKGADRRHPNDQRRRLRNRRFRVGRHRHERGRFAGLSFRDDARAACAISRRRKTFATVPIGKPPRTVEGSEWRAVMIIPLSSMRIHGGANAWRIGFFRGVAATAEHYTWAFDGLMQDAGAGNWPSFNDLRYWPSVTVALAKSSSARPQPRLEVFALSSSGETVPTTSKRTERFFRNRRATTAPT